MKKLSNIATSLSAIRTIAVIAIVAAVALGAWFIFRTSSIEVEKTKIDDTATQIAEIKQIGEWEFLTVQCETLVDTVRRRHWPVKDDRLARIYKGTVRLGIDLSKAGDKWVETQGDTLAILNLPAIGILDPRFIDEANTISFYESGKWDAKSKEQMYQRAVRDMRSYALTPNNLERARHQAEERFTALFQALGYKRVEVNFEP